MVVNVMGKRRLCLDLSRCITNVVEALKLKIESTVAVLQIVERNDFMFTFDLKSVYLQVKVNENYVKYLGLEDLGATRPSI